MKKFLPILYVLTVGVALGVATGLTPQQQADLNAIKALPQIAAIQDSGAKLKAIVLPTFLSNRTDFVVATNDLTQVALQNGIRTLGQRIGLSQTQSLAGMSVTISNYVASAATAAIGAQRAMDGATFKGWFATFLSLPAAPLDFTTNPVPVAVTAPALWTNNVPLTAENLEQ